MSAPWRIVYSDTSINRLADTNPRPPAVGSSNNDATDGAAVDPSQEGGNVSSWRLPDLEFESRFEGGNLGKAVRVGESEYDLLLTPDVNSSGHVQQWFNFRVRSTRTGVPYKFNILNLCKPTSMHGVGAQPVMLSEVCLCFGVCLSIV